jgi:hypothetical protein
MLVGFLKVFLQIIWRKLKEFKNYIFYFLNLKIKYNYYLLKKKIKSYSFIFFFNNNYILFYFLENLKRKIYNLVLILKFFIIEKKVKI